MSSIIASLFGSGAPKKLSPPNTILQTDADDPSNGHYDIANGPLNGDNLVSYPERILNLTLVNSDPENVTVMPTIENLPDAVRRIFFDDSCNAVVGISDNFLSECPRLIEVYFRNSTTAGGHFDNVVEIGKNFLAGNKEIAKLELNNVFPACIVVGRGFLEGCQSIKFIDMRDTFPSAEQIGGNFCSSVYHLEGIQFSVRTFASLEELGDECFCSSHCMRNFMPELCKQGGVLFPKLKKVPKRFLYGCSELFIVNIPNAFPCAIEVGDAFLSGSRNLYSLNLTNAFPTATRIGDEFLVWCSNVGDLSIEGMAPQVQQVGERFLGGLKNIKSISFPTSLPRLTDAGSRLLAGSTKLTDIDLSANTAIAASLAPGSWRGLTNLQHISVASEAAKIAVLAALGPEITNATDFDAEKVFTIVHGQWSWKHHGDFDASTRFAVLCVHQGLSYRDPRGESQYLPTEIAYKVCRFISK